MALRVGGLSIQLNSKYDRHGRIKSYSDDEYPSYPREVVFMVLDELGIELIDGDHDGWRRSFCPMHEERSASFGILIPDGGWKCRAGCGSSPDLAMLVHKTTGEPLAEAKRRLKMAIPSDPMTLVRMLQGGLSRQKESRILPPEPLLYDRGRVPKYMVNRGFTLDILQKWEVGYDQEFHCVVIPVKADGRLVGLVRRNLNVEGPKYLNTRGLTKGDILFGLDHVPTDCRDIAIVEGPMDCMWLHQNGIPAVAVLGSSLSERQAEIIRRRFWKVCLAFDNDKAGIVAGIDAAIKLGQLDVRAIKLPEGRKDVQECTSEELVTSFTKAASPWYTELRAGVNSTVTELSIL